MELEDERRARPPVLQNTDGEPLLLTVDHFAFEPALRAQIESALASIEGVEPPDPEDADAPSYAFLRPATRRTRLRTQRSPTASNTWKCVARNSILLDDPGRHVAIEEPFEHFMGFVLRHATLAHQCGDGRDAAVQGGRLHRGSLQVSAPELAELAIRATSVRARPPDQSDCDTEHHSGTFRVLSRPLSAEDRIRTANHRDEHHE